MPVCPYCSSLDLTRDGHNQRGRVVRACHACGRHATSESTSLVAGHRFPRDIILLAVRYYLQLGAAAERIAGLPPTEASTSVDGPFCAGSRSSGQLCLRRSVGTGSQ
jgi:transposase-like protein